jgi:ribosomal protein S18 acetylase RimI-like enzyme
VAGTGDLTVEEVARVDDDLVSAFAALVPQLSCRAHPPGAEELESIVGSPATALFVARDGTGRVVGSLTLALFRIPTGVRAWIEDVVFDADARGGGVGAALVGAALARAEAAGARTVDLTSRPDREAANLLYVRMGFVPRTTNVYRYSAD